MKAIHIREIDEVTLEGLKRRAQRHRRSLQKEILVLLSDAARMVPTDAVAATTVLGGLKTVSSGRTESVWKREEIYGEEGR